MMWNKDKYDTHIPTLWRNQAVLHRVINRAEGISDRSCLKINSCVSWHAKSLSYHSELCDHTLFVTFLIRTSYRNTMDSQHSLGTVSKILCFYLSFLSVFDLLIFRILGNAAIAEWKGQDPFVGKSISRGMCSDVWPFSDDGCMNWNKGSKKMRPNA